MLTRALQSAEMRSNGNLFHSHLEFGNFNTAALGNFKKGKILVFPKNNGTPKWMVIMENPIERDDLGVPLFLETSIWMAVLFFQVKC